jgi:hypothetical protein
MTPLLDRAGTALALAGLLVCGIAAITRLGGVFYLAGFELGVLFNAGVALLVLAVLAKVQVLVSRSGP